MLGCGRDEPLPVLGTIPAFSLTERHGTTVSADDLAGRVWVADFVFTRCPDICPVLSSRMAGLQEKLTEKSTEKQAGGDAPVRLVSISVDPVHDTPKALSAYAEHYRAGPDWLFLTGSRDAVAALLRDGFRVAFSDEGPATSPITHSDRFVLVDRQLRIRGYYHGNDPADLSRLVADAGRLRADPSA
jgi:cytochrome oxidase Cu insertion factor (SCO1/SenC/PrrC family)